MNERINFAGDVKIDEMRLYNNNNDFIDLTLAQITEVLIYESLWSPCLQGSLAVSDADAIIELFPIVGGEAFTLKLRTSTFPDSPTEVIHRSFVITSIENRRLENDRQQSYKLNFISIEGYTDLINSINQSIPGDTEGEGAFNTAKIAQRIFDNYIATSGRVYKQEQKSTLYIGDDHTSDIQYVSNGWSPFQNMNFIAGNTEEVKHPGSDVIFFETNKAFGLTSIQNLIASQKDNLFDQYFVGATASRKRHGGVGFSARNLIGKGFNDIEEIAIPKTIDIIEGSLNGHHASNVQAYDIYNKTRTHKHLDVVEDFDKFVHTGDTTTIPGHVTRNPDVYTNFKILNGNTYAGVATGIFDKGKKTSEEKYVGNVLKRNQYLNSFNNYTFTIDVPGRTDMEVGNMIYLDYPSATTKSDEALDETLSGRYLVTSIAHKVNIVTGHTMKMEVVKNGLGTVT